MCPAIACSASRDDRGCFPSGRILGVYSSSSMLVVHILQSRSSIQHLRPPRACLFLQLGPMPFECSCSGCRFSRDLRFCLFAPLYFPPRFASRKSTFFLTVSSFHQLRLQRKHNQYPEFPGLLTNRVVLEHAERAVGTRAAEGHEEAGQGHRHEADRDGS